MSVIHDTGVFFGHFKDAYDQKKYNMIFVDTDKEMTKKAVLKRNYFQNLTVDKAHRLEVSEKDNVVLKKDAKIQDLCLRRLRQKVEKLQQELEVQR